MVDGADRSKANAVLTQPAEALEPFEQLCLINLSHRQFFEENVLPKTEISTAEWKIVKTVNGEWFLKIEKGLFFNCLIKRLLWF